MNPFKCRDCGTTYNISEEQAELDMTSDKDTALCKWCAGELEDKDWEYEQVTGDASLAIAVANGDAPLSKRPMTCADCENELEGDGWRYAKYAPNTPLCDDCYDQQMN